MATTFKFSIVTPEGSAYADEVDYVGAPGLGGGFGVMARHAALLTVLKPGIVKIKRGDDTIQFQVEDGIAEVSENRMLILASRATPA
jgi:F-type H+-transporting ATPase subunit epsilon